VCNVDSGCNSSSVSVSAASGHSRIQRLAALITKSGLNAKQLDVIEPAGLLVVYVVKGIVVHIVQ